MATSASRSFLMRRNCLPPSVFGVPLNCATAVQPDLRLPCRRGACNESLLPVENAVGESALGEAALDEEIGFEAIGVEAVGVEAIGVEAVGAVEQWTEIGEVISATFKPHTTLLRKSCDMCNLLPSGQQQTSCVGCIADPVVGENGLGGATDDYDVFVPASLRAGSTKWPAENHAVAYQRKTQWTNSGAGYGFSGKRCALPRFAADGPNADLFSHPRTTIVLPNVRRYRLYARQIVGGCTSRWQYAVFDDACSKPSLLVLASDPRQPPFTNAALAEYGNYMLNGGLQTGDQIYVPGEFGVYDVYLYIDRDIFRQEKSVFRGYSPVRRMPGQLRKQPANSGLRNFTSHPSANALIFPY